jgi:hypothetical protein
MKKHMKLIAIGMVAVMAVAVAYPVYAAKTLATIWNPDTGEKQVVEVNAPMPAGFELWTGGTASGEEARQAILNPRPRVVTPAATPAVSTGTNLGDLIILDELFGGDNAIGGAQASSLGDLFVLNSLFGSGVVSGTSGTSGISGNSLGNLFVLDRLFASNNSIFRGNQTDLGDLLILNNIFK